LKYLEHAKQNRASQEHAYPHLTDFLDVSRQTGNELHAYLAEQALRHTDTDPHNALIKADYAKARVFVDRLSKTWNSKELTREALDKVLSLPYIFVAYYWHNQSLFIWASSNKTLVSKQIHVSNEDKKGMPWHMLCLTVDYRFRRIN
jgi:hypothetical protein